MQDPLKPTATLLIKLGSLAVHAEEFLSPNGHPFDRTSVYMLLNDPEVAEWLQQMDKMAFLPKKR